MIDARRVDFDYSYIHLNIRGKHRDSRDIALALSTYLIDRISLDEIYQEQQYPESFEPQFELEVGGMTMSYLTQSHQRAALANMLARYGNYRYSKCPIGINDYRCLKQLEEDLQSDLDRYTPAYYGRGITDYMSDISQYLKSMLHWFETEYSKQDQDFSKQIMFAKLQARKV